MRILAVDTTRKSAKIFLIDEKVNKVKELNESQKQSEFLMLTIDEFLKENCLQLGDIDCFGVVSGPGSFTGIRVGIATVKAFGYALGKQIISFNIFDLIKDEIKDGIFISECTSNSCYYVDIKNHNIVGVGVVDNRDIINFKKELYIIEEEHILTNSAYKFNVLKNYSELCCLKFKQMSASDQYSSPEPYYVQLSQAERNLGDKND